MGLVHAMKKCFVFTCIIHPAWWWVVLVHCGLYIQSVERASSHEQIPAALENPSSIVVRIESCATTTAYLHISSLADDACRLLNLCQLVKFHWSSCIIRSWYKFVFCQPLQKRKTRVLLLTQSEQRHTHTAHPTY